MALQIRKTVYRNTAGYKIVGKDSLGRQVSIFTPSRFKAIAIKTAAARGDHDAIDRILAGQSPS